MNSFLKAAAVLTMLCASGFAQELNLNVQSQENPNVRFEHYTNMKKWGMGLIAGGSAVIIPGVIIASSETSSIKIIGISISIGGFYVLNTGFPLYFCGRWRSKKYEKMLPSSIYMVPNGAQLVWNF